LPVKPTWSGKMTVLSTFLESSLNFLSRDTKNTKKSSTVREKSDVKVETVRKTVLKDSQGQNHL